MNASTGPIARRHPAPAIAAADLALDLVVLAMAAAVIAATLVLEPSEGSVILFGYELPPMCAFKRLTGMDCLGCGLTRSFTFVGHGDLRAAFGMHLLGPFLWVFVAAQVPYRLVRLGRRWRRW